MSAAQDQIKGHIQAKVNTKNFDYARERDMSEDIFGNLVGTRLNVQGQTRGSEVSFDSETTGTVSLDLGWTYSRKEFRGVLPPIDERRTDTGKYIFAFRLDLFNGLVVSERQREWSGGPDTSHDSPVTAFAGLIEDVIKPAFRIE